ncbi:MAG: DUF3524 domain-containing protein [Phycisphaerae bacterium]
MSQPLHVAILEPYYGGSHGVFVDTVVARSRHQCRAVTMPARKWKWRMRGAALWLTWAGEPWSHQPLDVVLCSDMLSVADLRALWPRRLAAVPVVYYMHENQLTYPLPPEQRRDFQFGMTNITSCLSADAVWFNSAFHREDFLSAADALLHKMPDYVPRGVANAIRGRSAVLAPPVDVDPPQPGVRNTRTDRPVRILWCHRWEFDKNPGPFFDALLRLVALDYPFELVVVGEHFRDAPPVFHTAARRLATRIVHIGHVPDRSAYLKLVRSCDVVVSAAIQENFGIAVVEAILSGCQPLLPNRLAYPEIIPRPAHHACLYTGDNALFPRLKALLDRHGWLSADELDALAASVHARFGADVAVTAMDDALVRVVECAKAGSPAAAPETHNVP